jgi:hypothetical protein
VWPVEYRPGCGHTHRPCGDTPTGIVAITLPFRVEIAYTLPVYLPASQITLPSGLTPPMSGVPGTRQVARTRLLANRITVIAPPARLVT